MSGVQKDIFNDMTVTIILNNLTWAQTVKLVALICPWSVRIAQERGLEL